MCEHFHGHNYVADFFVEGENQDEVGRVVDFSELKRRVKGWIDEYWDHAFLISHEDDNARRALDMVEPSRYYVLPYNPTAENMAKYLLEEICPRVLDGSGAKAVSVRIWEPKILMRKRVSIKIQNILPSRLRLDRLSTKLTPSFNMKVQCNDQQQQ